MTWRVHLGDGQFAPYPMQDRPSRARVHRLQQPHHRPRARSPVLLADAFGVYFPVNQSVYIVPIAEATGYVGRLRLEAARNNQRRGIRLAVDYAIGARTRAELTSMLRDAVAFSARERERQVA